jgi:hypothetical protein
VRRLDYQTVHFCLYCSASGERTAGGEAVGGDCGGVDDGVCGVFAGAAGNWDCVGLDVADVGVGDCGGDECGGGGVGGECGGEGGAGGGGEVWGGVRDEVGF